MTVVNAEILAFGPVVGLFARRLGHVKNNGNPVFVVVPDYSLVGVCSVGLDNANGLSGLSGVFTWYNGIGINFIVILAGIFLSPQRGVVEVLYVWERLLFGVKQFLGRLAVQLRRGGQDLRFTVIILVEVGRWVIRKIKLVLGLILFLRFLHWVVKWSARLIVIIEAAVSISFDGTCFEGVWMVGTP